MDNKEKYNETMRNVHGVLKQYKYTPHVAARVYGKLVYLNEAKVRALMCLAARAAKESDEAFEEFTKNVIIYSGSTQKRSHHKMSFRKDGLFYNDFEGGFFSANCDMAFEIL